MAETSGTEAAARGTDGEAREASGPTKHQRNQRRREKRKAGKARKKQHQQQEGASGEGEEGEEKGDEEVKVAETEEAAGLKNASVGGAVVSDRHANFIVNNGGATAQDILTLMERVRERVRDACGVDLEPELKIWS